MSNRKKKLRVCPRCEGYATVANPAFDGMSTSEMYDDMGYEETHEFLEEYCRRGGMYDINCPLCGGRRVVTKKQIKDYEATQEMYREMEAERRMMGMGQY